MKRYGLSALLLGVALKDCAKEMSGCGRGADEWRDSLKVLCAASYNDKPKESWQGNGKRRKPRGK